MAPDRGAGELIYVRGRAPASGPLESRPSENEDKRRFHVCISNPCRGLRLPLLAAVAAAAERKPAGKAMAKRSSANPGVDVMPFRAV
jgi:hypothetical protein